jgi:hypothetical protein
MDPDPSDVARNLRLAVASGELTNEDGLEEAASKLEEIIWLDFPDIVELAMTLEEKGIRPTVGELIKLLEGNDSDTGEFPLVIK